MLLFVSQSCSKSFCFGRAVTCPSFVCILAPVCVCFQPLCPVGGPANTHTHTHTHKLHSDTLCSRSSSFFRYLATSYFLSFPGSFSGPRRLLFRPTLPRSLLPVFTPPPLSFQSHSSQPSHCILDERHGIFFFSLSFTYSRLTVLLQRHSFAPNKEIIQRVQGTAFRERCLAGDLL